MNILKEILQAENRIRPYILTTPVLESKPLSKLNNGKVFLKLESEQHTGSFKARGSMNKVLSLSEGTEMEANREIITASTGNHALGFARALLEANKRGIIYMPKNASPSKVKALKDYPVDLVFFGTNSLATELEAKRVAKEKNAIWISPYNDPQIIGGQGTIGIELTQQLKTIDYVLVTVGGGGLIAGIATFVKYISPETKIIGCLPSRSPEMALSVEAGKIIELENPQETISDGSAGGVEPDAITFPICQELVDDFILVKEEEIKTAIKLVVNEHHKIIEGAAGVAVASFIKEANRFEGKNVAIIICGSNIATEKLVEIIQ